MLRVAHDRRQGLNQRRSSATAVISGEQRPLPKPTQQDRTRCDAVDAAAAYAHGYQKRNSGRHALTSHLLEEWTNANGTFAGDPPNATVSVFNKDASSVRDAVVVLKTPKLEGDKLTFDVDVLEGDLTGGDGPASVFIDRFGFGFGGVGRPGVGVGGVGRVGVGVGRAAWYRGAAVGAAAVGTAAAYGAYAAPACGYYPYPPCY